MVKNLVIVSLGLILWLPSFAQSQPFGPKLQPGDLKVIELRINPDPVREGQRMNFQAILANASKHSGEVSLFIKDKDEVVTAIFDMWIKPGENRITFPETKYRFTREEYCFTVEVDIERTRRSIDVAREFCARKTFQGWSMTIPRIGPLFVEDLDMVPDPAKPGQEIRFRARLKNNGKPLRADIRIQDRDQIVSQLTDAFIPHGHFDFYFPFTRYQFQRHDHCFIVVVDVERTPSRVDASREFCAKPYGWSLRP